VFQWKVYFYVIETSIMEQGLDN